VLLAAFYCLGSSHRSLALPRAELASREVLALAARVVVQSGRYSFRGPRLPLVLEHRLRPRGLLRALDFTGLCAQNFRAGGVMSGVAGGILGVAYA
jgi:hypothetical protein